MKTIASLGRVNVCRGVGSAKATPQFARLPVIRGISTRNTKIGKIIQRSERYMAYRLLIFVALGVLTPNLTPPNVDLWRNGWTIS